MKAKIFTTFIACAFSLAALQAQVFIIERGSSTLTFTTIKAAVDALQDNDKLFIPPGTHSLKGYNWTGYDDTENHSNKLVVNKKVAIFGAGYSDGANSTILKDGEFMIGKDASGSSISGIRFDLNFVLDNISNCIVSRCRMNYYFYLSGLGNNIVITECDIVNTIYSTSSSYKNLGGNGLVATVSKCIFRNYPRVNTVNIYNSVFHSPYFDNCTNTNISNSIILVSETVTNSAATYLGVSNVFSNNLWVGGYPSPVSSNDCTLANNIEREAFANVFVDKNNNDFHLKPGCKGIGAGSDGTDVGLYGTTMPFKDSKLPSIPYFKTKVISPETNAAGKLPVHIQVEAQDN